MFLNAYHQKYSLWYLDIDYSAFSVLLYKSGKMIDAHIQIKRNAKISLCKIWDQKISIIT